MDEDPAAAARTPESAMLDAPVHAVGIGPGDPAYLTPRGQQAIEQADVVVGFETVINHVQAHVTGTILKCGYRDQTEQLAAFAEAVAAGQTGTAVLMGDPNVSGYQFLGRVERAVKTPVHVIPGISSIQVAASRARTPLEASTIVTLHKRGPLEDALDRLVADAAQRNLIVIPRPYDWMPGDIAGHLVEHGTDPRLEAFVYEELTQDGEAQTHATLGELATEAGGTAAADSPFSDLSILVITSKA